MEGIKNKDNGLGHNLKSSSKNAKKKEKQEILHGAIIKMVLYEIPAYD
ncbi:hypothetical protein [Listeria rustica]|uniref:Uncharacterized protein n=1 Tax=Listeria rustica TaxID=2713503 RepID=A0A7W1T4P4_9LIST|nr:hypothetical protein [Listeria rustica]MBA3925317.1 hypothetical protein [Listeria rustica]